MIAGLNAREWDETIARLPGMHLLQSWEWGEVKKAYGWQPITQTWVDAAGQVKCASLTLQRTVSPLRLRILYVPRGPLVDWSDPYWRERALNEMESTAQRQHAMFIKIDPEVLLGKGIPGSEYSQEFSSGASLQEELRRRGWQYSPEQVQFRNTVIVDLTQSEEAWLAGLKQKARYNLRLGEKRGVTTRLGTVQDLPMLYQMYAETSVRDGFLIRSQDYYDTLWKTFLDKDMLEPLIAEVDGQAVAGIMVFYLARKAWYLQGMSTSLHREKMPNYQLQWSAMRRARARGCESYDLWGAPENFSETDPLWGVFRFKESIGGHTIRTLGAWDFPAQPLLYSLYMKVFPKILDIMRRRGREQTRQEVIG